MFGQGAQTLAEFRQKDAIGGLAANLSGLA